MEKKFNHAFLIGLYQNPEYAASLIESLRGERSNIYVHINPLCLPIFKGFMEHYGNDENVQIIHTQPIHWGGYSLMRSMLDLLNLAMVNEENGFFHMLTGQDLLIKPLTELYSFFDDNNDKNYLSYGDDQMLNPQRGYLLGVNRSQYVHLFDKLNYRGNMLHRQIEKYFVKAQQWLHIKRNWPFPNYYQGSGWFSFNRKAVEEILKFMKVNHGIAENTFAPDEVMFQSILLNSKINHHVVNDNLRFIQWDNKGEVGSPVILTEQHFDMMVKSHCFFARKVHPEKSKQLIEKINNHLKTNTL